MQVLYPNIQPYATHRLPVSDLHELYVEESGSPYGIPVLVVHGGPGAGCHANQRRYFDPSKYRIILFDQRGCGRSTPIGELTQNTTQDLINDIETLRKTLDIKQFVLFGGSWGATLSLLYAQAYPAHVKALLLRSVLLANQADHDWLFCHGAPRVFPDAWQAFTKPIEKKYHNDLIGAYYQLLNADNELQRMATAKHWVTWQRQCSTLRAHPQNGSASRSLQLARISTHYCQHRFFIDNNQILKNMMSLRKLSGIIIHGRYDMICTLSNAYELHQRWPRAELDIIRDAGHASDEPGLLDAIIRATNKLAKNQGVS